MRPYPFQKECVIEIERFEGRALISCEMGLGKTLISLWWAKRHDNSLPAVIVCPASVKYHWEQEAKRVRLQSMVLEGRRSSRLPDADLIILNYDILRYWFGRLREMKPQTIIADECQMVANQTKRTRAFVKLCKGVPHVLGLSGTPLVNRPIELWTILHTIRPDAFKSRMTYAHRYCAPQLIPWGWKYQGATHTRELHRILKVSIEEHNSDERKSYEI